MIQLYVQFGGGSGFTPLFSKPPLPVNDSAQKEIVKSIEKITLLKQRFFNPLPPPPVRFSQIVHILLYFLYLLLRHKHIGSTTVYAVQSSSLCTALIVL